MSSRILVLAVGLSLSLAAGPGVAGPLFFDDFERAPLASPAALGDDWTGKGGVDSYFGTIVANPAPDSVNSSSRVLSFTGLQSAGDIYTDAAFSSPNGAFRFSFDYYGDSGKGGGFAGVSAAFPGSHWWLAGDAGYPGILQSLTNDSSWHHYELVFTAGSIHLMFEDFVGGAGRVPGDAYFDNVELEAVPEPTSLLLVGSGLTGLALRRRRKS